MNIDWQAYWTKVTDWMVEHTLPIILILLMMFIAVNVIRFVATRVTGFLSGRSDDIEYKKRADTLSSIVRWVLRMVVFVIAFMMLLKECGVDIGPVIAAAGVVGLAVGFGAQNLVSDVISGFFILLEDQIRVGDVVQLNDKGGLVERITLRMVILRDLAGNVHFVRNGKIDVVTNMTKEYSRYVFNVGVAYREDTDEVVNLLKEIDEELRKDDAFKNDIIAPLEVLGVDQFADSAVIIKARTTTRPIQQWRIGREFNRRMKKKFDERGIEIPFPHRTVYFGIDKEGDAPPARVEMRNGSVAS